MVTLVAIQTDRLQCELVDHPVLDVDPVGAPVGALAAAPAAAPAAASIVGPMADHQLKVVLNRIGLGVFVMWQLECFRRLDFEM